MRRAIAGFLGVFFLCGCNGGTSGANPDPSPPDLGRETSSHKTEPILVASVASGPVTRFAESGLDAILATLLKVDANEAADCGQLISCGGQSLTRPAAACYCDSVPWVARILVTNGPNVLVAEQPSVYWEDSQQSLWLWRETRNFNVEVLDIWLGAPRRTEYVMVDTAGYCPGDMLWPDEDLRIPGVWFAQSQACEYRNPKTGELLARISGLEAPSRLEVGKQYLAFGADALSGLTDDGLWDYLERFGVEPESATFSGPERLLYKYLGNEVDISTLVHEWGTGTEYSEPLVTETSLASILVAEIVEPFLEANPGKAAAMRGILHGVLLHAYLD